MLVSYWSGMVELACWVSDDSDVDAQSTTVQSISIYSAHAVQVRMFALSRPVEVTSLGLQSIIVVVTY